MRPWSIDFAAGATSRLCSFCMSLVHEVVTSGRTLRSALALWLAAPNARSLCHSWPALTPDDQSQSTTRTRLPLARTTTPHDETTTTDLGQTNICLSCGAILGADPRGQEQNGGGWCVGGSVQCNWGSALSSQNTKEPKAGLGGPLVRRVLDGGFAQWAMYRASTSTQKH